jgi:single-strand DNA-binding protein
MEQVRGTVNRVELIGWIGAEPEQRFIPSGAAVCSFRVATKRPAGRNESGERLFETDWTPIEAWDKLAEQCGRYLRKGSRVRVVGSLHTRSWEDRESGQKRFKTIVRAEEVLFLDTRQEQQDETEAAEEAVEVVEVVEDLPF